MPKTTKLLLAVLALAGLLAVPAAADAKTNVRIGIGDQQAAMFDHAEFKKLKIKRVRYFIRWDAVDHDDVMRAADAYVDAARRNKVKVLMHISSDNLERKKAKLPKLSTYKSKVRRLVNHFRKKGVKEWGARNEANHDSQATWRPKTGPKRAAQEFLYLRQICKGCTIVALDVLDQAGVERYIQRFYRALGSRARYARIVGIHNYSDINRKRTRGTRSIIKTAKRYNRRASFWLTETGGVVNFGKAWPYNTSRAANRLKFLFSTTKKLRRDIDRVYVYNWTGAERGARFDAGVVGPHGEARPALKVLRDQLKNFLR
jgi:hypothetical protein